MRLSREDLDRGMNLDATGLKKILEESGYTHNVITTATFRYLRDETFVYMITFPDESTYGEEAFDTCLIFVQYVKGNLQAEF